ncbi:MAG: 50S ribosomal protein L13 [Candidatus Pacearchaeota archaeon]
MVQRIIDGAGISMGRLATYAAKQSLKGDEIHVVNCGDTVITGNKWTVHSEFREKRNKVGDTQQGPKHIRKAERIVKRAIRGMLPGHRQGRGREAWKRIRCYKEIPQAFEGQEMEKLDKGNKIKKVKVRNLEK